MNDDIDNRLRQIQTENYIWILYLFIIGFCFYANTLEKKYFLTKDVHSKNLYREINAFVFVILIFVYGYFEKEAILSFQNKKKSLEQKKFDTLSLVASTAVFISGCIFLYIILEDDNLDEEVAFN